MKVLKSTNLDGSKNYININADQSIGESKLKSKEVEDKIFEIEVYDNKYKVIFYKDGNLKALRYNKEWRDLTGDGMMLALCQEIVDLREMLELEIKQHQYIEL